MIKVDVSGTYGFCNNASAVRQAADAALHTLLSGTGAGAAFTGWVRYPENYAESELARIKIAADKIQSESEVFVVLGIGGSYLGAKAAVDMLRSPEYNLLSKNTPDIYFSGNDASGAQLARIIRLVDARDFSVCVISKSGSTAETASAFRVFSKLLTKRYGKQADSRIYTITDAETGYLRAASILHGWESFIIPRDIGGRYSVLTPVGLLPMAVAGIDIEKVLAGARTEMESLLSDNGGDASVYAAMRQALYQSGKKIEILSGFEPALRYTAEWWKQLFAESEGKDKKGIFPASANMTADLHSIGQLIQDGERNLFETMLLFREQSNLVIPGDSPLVDGIDWLGGKRYAEFCNAVIAGTKKAHIAGGVPVIDIDAGTINEETYGALTYFFLLSCGISGYLSGVNPFNQPGVEEYKRNMKAILA